MVEQQSDADIDRVFRALADATRRDIVRRTLVAEQSVTQLAAAYAMSFAAVSKHIAVLAEARLITKRAEGRVRLVRADPAALARAQELLRSYEHLWRGRIDRLDALLAEPEATVPRAGAAAATASRAETPAATAPIAEAPDATTARAEQLDAAAPSAQNPDATASTLRATRAARTAAPDAPASTPPTEP